jgi:hypothetical protein
MNEDRQSDVNDDFEQKKKLQQRLHKLLEECENKNIDCEPKLIEFVERATHAKKDYTAWGDIVKEIINSL